MIFLIKNWFGLSFLEEEIAKHKKARLLQLLNLSNPNSCNLVFATFSYKNKKGINKTIDLKKQWEAELIKLK